MRPTEFIIRGSTIIFLLLSPYISYSNNSLYLQHLLRLIQIVYSKNVLFSIRCDHGHPVKVPPVESYVMVLQPQQPSITINGTVNVARDYQDFRQGVHVFTDLHISVLPAGKPWKHGK